MTHTERFAQALQDLEATQDLDPFLAQFTDYAVLLRPETHAQQSGPAGARTFWQSYLAQFHEVSSTFSRLVEAGPLGELEWTSTGTTAAGAPLRYTGVSLLELNDDGKVTRFATYYDTAAFTPPGPLTRHCGLVARAPHARRPGPGWCVRTGGRSAGRVQGFQRCPRL